MWRLQGLCLRGFFPGGSLRPLELLGPEAEHSRFSPHCRPDGAPNRTALLPRLPELNRNPQAQDHSALFLVSRAEAGGKQGGG